MSNTLALVKLQPEPVGHGHGSCAEKVGSMRGLILSGANFKVKLSSCVTSFPITSGKKLPPLESVPTPHFQH